jgi:Gpi18-like mannosyltransferase
MLNIKLNISQCSNFSIIGQSNQFFTLVLSYTLFSMLKSINKETRLIGILYLLVFFALTGLKTKMGHYDDLQFWNYWASFNMLAGLGRAYDSGTDYLPLFHYFLYWFGCIKGSSQQISAQIYQIKVIPIAFEMISTIMLFRFLVVRIKDVYKAFTLSLLYLCNLGIMYNCVVWGQVDGIFTTFIFLSFLAAYKEKQFASVLFLILAINMKLQAMVFFPLIGLMLLPQLLKMKLPKVLLLFCMIPVVQTLILLPFILEGQATKVWDVITGSFGHYPYVSMNAYNSWNLFYPYDLTHTSDQITFLGITLKSYGLAAFFISSFFVLKHLLIGNIDALKGKNYKPDLRLLLISATLIPMLFFYFNTQMHERYVHPAFIFLTLYAILYNRYWLLLSASLAYYMNLEDVLRYFETENYHTVMYSSPVISSLYLITIIGLFIDLFKKPSLKIQAKWIKSDAIGA